MLKATALATQVVSIKYSEAFILKWLYFDLSESVADFY